MTELTTDEKHVGGLLSQLFSADGAADPFPIYAKFHDYGEASGVGGGMVVAFGFDAVSAVLRDPKSLVFDEGRKDEVMPGWRDHPSLAAGSVLDLNLPEHGPIRRLMSDAFTPRRVARLQSAIEELTDRLITSMAERGADGSAVDFMAEFAYQLPVSVICELLGIPDADRAAFGPVARDLLPVLEGTPGPELFQAADSAAVWLYDYLRKLIVARREDPGDDMISALVHATGPDGGHLSEYELLGNSSLLLIAGFVTTTNLLGNGLRVILTQPAIAAGLRDGSIGTDAFVTEVLRCEAPVQATSRWRREPGEAGGVPVAAGEQVVLLIGAANRDPRKFADPNTFNPARQDAGALSFGAGPHYCLGAALARLEAVVAFPRLLARFPRLAAAGDPVRSQSTLFWGFDEQPVSVA
jgi:cytochrome P450